jgi:hypothetical protein
MNKMVLELCNTSDFSALIGFFSMMKIVSQNPLKKFRGHHDFATRYLRLYELLPTDHRNGVFFFKDLGFSKKQVKSGFKISLISTNNLTLCGYFWLMIMDALLGERRRSFLVSVMSSVTAAMRLVC